MRTEIKARPELKVMDKEKIRQILEPGEVGAILELVVTDKNGNITQKRVMKSKSFVRQFLELLWVEAYKITEILEYTIRDTSNALQEISSNHLSFSCDAGAGVITHGIVVGTGNTAPTINDYVIETLIDHDAAPPTAGRLQYSAVTFGAPAADATTSQFTITRNFANGSGGAITVNEVGLYVSGGRGTNTFYFLEIRDVIGGGINVPNGQTLTVNYRIQAVA